VVSSAQERGKIITMNNLWILFLDFLFPRGKLEKKLDNLSALGFYEKCERNRRKNKTTLSVFDYSDKLVKQSIWSLKFRGNKKIGAIFGEILYDELLENISELEIISDFKKPLLVPIPVSKKRLRERGYNQCEIIAMKMEDLDGEVNFEVKKNALVKIKDTPPQSRYKNRKERLSNLKGCFAIKKPNQIKNRNIILLDDVTTTGATLNEAKKILRRSGAKKIICLTIAH